MIARLVWLPLLLLVVRGWALQQGHDDSSIPAGSKSGLGGQVSDFLQRLASPDGEPIMKRAEIAPGAAAAPRHPMQTPPPSRPLLARQDNGQVAALSAQIQSLSLASSLVSQASRSVSQTSQQLAQQVTQLSQSTDRLSQSIIQLQNSAQQAQQSAQQAQDAARQASQSASSAISVAISSAQSSANSAIAASLASVTSSAASIMAAASASAVNIAKVAASQVQAAQADATGARADAATQVQKAEGTAVSVTQAAVAIVGTFFGSSLLTIGAFYLILRYKTKQKRRRTQLMAMRGDGNERAGNGGGAYGYPIDLKQPPTRKPVGGDSTTFGDEKRRPSSDYRPREDRDSSADAGNRFAMFGAASSAGSADELVGSGNGKALPSTLARAAAEASNPTRPAPSLQQWLSEGTVSPFGTLRRESARVNSNNARLIGQAISSGDGPAERRQQQLRAMMKQSSGVGGVNGGLPFRDR